ncbi:MAG: 2-hydroxyacid dehydrogenase [Verrucomicrobiota bacterium]
MLTAVYDTKPYDRLQLEHASAGTDIAWRFWDFRLTAATAASASGATAICAFVNDQLDRPCLTSLASAGVKLVALRSTGFNHVDLAAARDLQLTVARVAVYSPHAVAEHAIALLLTLNRKIHRAFNRVRELNFSLNGLVGFDLHGKTAGILGTGKIGRITAQILRGFGMRVMAFDPVPDQSWAAHFGVEYLDREMVMRSSDVLSLHVPLTPETKHLIRRETLAEMKAGAIILNVSRGGLIDTTGLIEALKSGRLGGVALDVYEEEEGIFFEDLSAQVLLDDELARLLTFPNVLITAHQAFLTREALGDIARVTVANLHAFAQGKPLEPGTVLTSQSDL